mgnify:FL=1
MKICPAARPFPSIRFCAMILSAKFPNGGEAMIGLGTTANVSAIVLGGCAGLLLRGGLKER